MKTFVFVVTPTTIKELQDSWTAFRYFPEFLVRMISKSLSPLNALRLDNLTSAYGKQIQGCLVVMPLLQPRVFEGRMVLEKLISACHFAERIGAAIVGVNSYAGKEAGEKSAILNQQLTIPVTNGNAFCAWSIVEIIYRLARLNKINLKQASLTVVDATTPVGNLCSRKLADYFSKVIICSSDKEKLEALKSSILNTNAVEVIIEEDPQKAARDADFVVNACAQQVTVSAKEFMPVIRAGLIKVPFTENLNLDRRLPKNVISAAMAETLLLTFAERFTSYSLGEQINLDKLEEIADLAVRYGFEVWAPEAPVL